MNPHGLLLNHGPLITDILSIENYDITIYVICFEAFLHLNLIGGLIFRVLPPYDQTQYFVARGLLIARACWQVCLHALFNNLQPNPAPPASGAHVIGT